MNDDCLLELYSYLTPEARGVFDTLGRIGGASMEKIMLTGHLTTQQARRGVWGLACTGLIKYERGLPVNLSDNGARLVKLLIKETSHTIL